MSNFRIKTCVLGPVSTNCYLIYDDDTKRAVIVDPADNGAYIEGQCRTLGLKPEAVLLTHGHFDHILALRDVCQAFGCRVYAGEKEIPLLRDPALSLTKNLGIDLSDVPVDVPVKDGDVLELMGYQWKVMETPGHTEGSVCYYLASEGVLMSGDTLFEDSLGRTDFPTGDSRKIIHSIGEKLLTLPEDTMVYPGHGNPTTIGHERVYNPVAIYLSRRK